MTIRDTQFNSMRFDIDSGKPLITPLASTYWIDISGFPIIARAIGDVLEARRHTTLPIIGTGGVVNWQTAVEMVMAGATAVGMQTVALIETPYVINRIYAGLEAYFKTKGYDSLDAIRGIGIKKIEEEWKAKRKYSVKLDEVFCNGCSLCEMACIYDAITMKDHKPVIDYQTCSNCCLCHVVCPQHAIKLVIE